MNFKLYGGFEDPPYQSAYIFRSIMSAMANPGMIEVIEGIDPPRPLESAAAAICLTLCDQDCSIALNGIYDTKEVNDWLIFHTGVKIKSEENADFILTEETKIAPLNTYRQGTEEYPDRSSTVIVATSELNNKKGIKLSGPGIQSSRYLSLSSIKPFRHGMKPFPLGVDFILFKEDRLACLPRSTKMEQL